MKHSFCLISAILVLLCSCSTKQNSSGLVTYPGATLPSLTGLMSSIEVVRLQHGDSILTDDRTRLFHRDTSFYLVDIAGEKNIYRFAQDGRFLNKVGQKGRGPEEYPDITDVAIAEDSDDVYVLSSPGCIITRYAKDGTFKAKSSTDIPATCLCRVEQGFWVFAGYPDRSLLLRLGDSLHITDSVRLQQFLMDRYVYPIQKMSSSGNQAYFWHYPYPVVYHLDPDTVRQALFFDIEDQYIPARDIPDRETYKKEKIEGKRRTCISKYWENGTYALAEIGVMEKDQKEGKNIYGLKTKASGQWQWVEYTTTPENPFIRDWYPTRVQDFAQDGRLMCFLFGVETEELTDEARQLIVNPQELENVDTEMDMFVLLCTFK